MANPAKFVREVKSENAKVVYPTRKETGMATLTVFVITVIAMLFFLLVDNLAGWAISAILGT